ncbi:hypothetical protein [Bradyrhizobium vignae]|uniref:hypothetical protein n=1 Tax=Bradyrhizobium vignae TaxID=1549949 RepID=UPI0011AE41D4|nr:hypothetical protein [Bradyrhizobium vignae]
MIDSWKNMKQRSPNYQGRVQIFLALVAWIWTADSGRADPLVGGAEPNIQNRIEQTVPSATDRLLNDLRERPPTYSGTARKLRTYPSQRRNNNTNTRMR